MKIHRVVQMLGATTSTGKLAEDMYNLGHKDYYSKADDRYIPISHMDFQHMVRAFVKLTEQEGNVKELKQSLDSSHRAYKMGFERNGRHIEEVKKLELENQRLVQRKANDIVSKEAYQVMWDNCEKLKEDLKKTDDIVEKNDRIYKKNLQKQEDNLLYLTSKIENMKAIIEEKEESAEYWKNTYYNSQPKGCGYVFSEIPNDTDGQEFVDKMKKYFNKISYKMRVRGQHIKPELKGTGATYWGQTRDESTHMRIYIDNKK